MYYMYLSLPMYHVYISDMHAYTQHTLRDVFAQPVQDGMTFLAEWQKQIHKRTSRVPLQIARCPIAQSDANTLLCVSV